MDLAISPLVDMPVSALMDRRVVSVDIDDTVEKVEQVLEKEGLSTVPVRGADGKCFGVITLADLRHFHALKKKAGAHRAWEICTHRVIEVGPQERVREVTKSMIRNRIHHVIICEKDKIIGLVSSFDLLAKYLVDSEKWADTLR